jgi:lysophospholipase L1-like esterase
MIGRRPFIKAPAAGTVGAAVSPFELSFRPSPVPTDVAGCVCWLKAGTGVYRDAGVTAAADGDLVQQWNDQSGAGNHAIQTTSSYRLKWNAQNGQIESNDTTLGGGNKLAYFNVPNLNLNTRGMSAFFILGDLVTLIGGDVNHTFLKSASGAACTFGYASFSGSLADTTFRKLRVNDGTNHYGLEWVPTGPSLLGISAGPTSCNLVVNSTVDIVAALAAGTAAGVNILGRTPNPRADLFWGGVKDVVIYNRQLSASEINKVQNYAFSRGAIDTSAVENVVAFAGDSISASYGPALNKGWQRQMRPSLPPALEFNVSLNGSKITDLQSRQSTKVDPYIRPGKRNGVVFYAGVNDLYNGGTGSAAYANLCSLTAAARAAGWDWVAVVSMLPAKMAIVSQSFFDTERAVFNNLLRNDGLLHFDALADVGASTVIGQNGQNMNPAYYVGDWVHPNAAAHTIIASTVASAIRPLMAGGTPEILQPGVGGRGGRPGLQG